MPLQEGLDAPLHPRLRPATVKLVTDQPRRARLRFRPDDARVASFNRDQRTVLERFSREISRELGFDPLALIERPGERGAAAGPRGAGELQGSAAVVEAQPKTAGTAHRTDL